MLTTLSLKRLIATNLPSGVSASLTLSRYRLVLCAVASAQRTDDSELVEVR